MINWLKENWPPIFLVIVIAGVIAFAIHVDKRDAFETKRHLELFQRERVFYYHNWWYKADNVTVITETEANQLLKKLEAPDG